MLEYKRSIGLVSDGGTPFLTDAEVEFNKDMADTMVYGNVSMLGGAALGAAGKFINPIISKIGGFFGKGGSEAYQGFRNTSADFVNGTKLTKHFGDHADDFGFAMEDEYLQGARNFFEKSPTKTMQGFTSEGGTYFQYDTATNEFGIINQYGGISTYYKPVEGLKYWNQQMESYMPK
ncbi:hypothetical protein [Desulfosporosinus sp. I2]|uniref:hypothetical protein n=1 Tax=Desulfosporosinus sp. I2 TaxID=1617025 RepID=UPI0012E0541E|nr:hypothetical protein [Desulfosporosinus sp. I2]